MVSIHADARFFEGSVRHAAAADIDLSKLWMMPGVNHFGAPGFQHLLYRILHHLHIVRLNIFKPSAVARFRLDLLRNAKQDTHGTVRIHPGLTALLQLDRPDTGSGTLQNIFQALSRLQFVLLLLLYHRVDIPQRKNGAVLPPSLLHRRKMKLQMFQSIGIFPHLIPDIKLLLCPQLIHHKVFSGHGKKPLFIPRNHILGNILLHSPLIAVLEAYAPGRSHLFVVSVYLTFIRIEIQLIDAQIIHAEGMENVITLLLKFANQIAPLQRRYDKICRRLKHIRCIFQ